MKKKLLFYLILFFTFLSFVPVHAAPTTFTRTKDDLRLPYDVGANDVVIEEVLKTPSVDEKAKIYDFANVLTEAEETKIYIQISEYIKNTGVDAVIVITNDLKGDGMDVYTNHFYNYNNFDENGIALVIYAGADRTSLYMGKYGPLKGEVFTAYSDKAMKEILKYVYENHLATQDYVGACETYIKLVDGFYVKSFGDYRVGEEKEKTSFPWIEILIVSTALSFIIVVLVYTKYQKPPRYGDITVKNALNDTSMIVKCEYDKPVTEKVQNNKQDNP